MRLIDADALKRILGLSDDCKTCKIGDTKNCQLETFNAYGICTMLDDAPTVDAVPVVHGRLEGNETCEAYDIAGVKTWAVKRKCSICGFTHKFIEAHMCYTFCPNCGAKMDAKRDDECTDCERDCTMCGVRFEKED